MRLLFLLSAFAAVTACKAGTSDMPTTPITWSQVESRPAPPAGHRVTYGNAPQQFGELRVPAGEGPFPVAVLIHGGCWLNEFDYVYFNHLADALTTRDRIATWTIEYRRLGDPGGGWPGTFLDAGAAVDHLRVLAKDHPLDLERVVTVGHSAGGHLALWLAARARLPHEAALWVDDPLPLKGAVGLAAITDLATYRKGEPGSCNSAVDTLMGGTDIEQAARYRIASPLALLPNGVPQWLVQGTADPIVPVAGVRAYVEAARKAGDTVTLLAKSGAGHFDPAVPDTMAWPEVEQAVKAATEATAAK